MKTFLEQFTVFARYSAAGLASLGFELVLLYGLLHFLNVPYYVSVSIAFIVSTIVQYGVCHLWVFGNSGRPLQTEYVYFASILLTGLLLTNVLVILFVNVFAMSVVLARLASGIFTGLWDFYLNARFNFRAHAFLRR